MFFIHSQYDSMSYHQLADVQCKLAGAGVGSSQYQVLTIPGGSQHAFQYGRDWDPSASLLRISDRVIIFLNAYLQ
jgi:hypothetical protein